MFLNLGRVPGFIVVLYVALCSWAAPVAAQQRVPLTIAEAGDLALSEEPGSRALLARASALEDHAVAARQLPDPVMRIGLANFPIEGGGFSTEGMTQAQLGIRQVFPRARSPMADRFQGQAEALTFDADARRREVLAAVRRLNADPCCDGILLQLPLPAGLEAAPLLLAMDPEKARRYRESSVPEHEDSCTMCGKMCAVRNMNRVLEGKDIQLND